MCVHPERLTRPCSGRDPGRLREATEEESGDEQSGTAGEAEAARRARLADTARLPREQPRK
eukprot:3070925-Rhodomonas_salina.1